MLKATALVTSLCLLVEQSLYAQVPLPVFTPQTDIKSKIFQQQMDFNLPPDLGKVTQSWGGTPSVILIEDAHGQYTAQKTIEDLLEYLDGRTGFSGLWIEGAVGQLHPEALEFFIGDEFNLEAAELLARHAEIGGPELYLFKRHLERKNTGEGNPRKAFGLENTREYLQDLELFNRVLRGQNTGQIFLRDELSQIEKMASQKMNAGLHGFFREWLAYEETSRSIERYLGTLSRTAGSTLKVDLSDPRYQLEWPMLVRLYELKARESKLDLNRARMERDSLLEWAKNAGIPEWMVGVIKSDSKIFWTDDSLQPVRDRRTFWELFYEWAAPKGFRFQDYSYLALSEGFLILQSEIEAEDLYREIDRIHAAIVESLIRNRGEREIVKRFRQYLGLKKLFSLELVREEYDSLISQKNRSKLPAPVEELYRRALAFYRLAIKRDAIMADTLLKAGTPAPAKPSVLVMGGFHTQAFTDRLRSEGVSFAVIQPHMMEISNNREYVNAMTGSRLHFDFHSEVSEIRQANWLAPWGGRLHRYIETGRAQFTDELFSEFLDRGARINPGWARQAPWYARYAARGVKAGAARAEIRRFKVSPEAAEQRLARHNTSEAIEDAGALIRDVFSTLNDIRQEILDEVSRETPEEEANVRIFEENSLRLKEALWHLDHAEYQNAYRIMRKLAIDAWLNGGIGYDTIRLNGEQLKDAMAVLYRLASGLRLDAEDRRNAVQSVYEGLVNASIDQAVSKPESGQAEYFGALALEMNSVVERLKLFRDLSLGNNPDGLNAPEFLDYKWGSRLLNNLVKGTGTLFDNLFDRQGIYELPLQIEIAERFLAFLKKPQSAESQAEEQRSEVRSSREDEIARMMRHLGELDRETAERFAENMRYVRGKFIRQLDLLFEKPPAGWLQQGSLFARNIFRDMRYSMWVSLAGFLSAVIAERWPFLKLRKLVSDEIPSDEDDTGKGNFPQEPRFEVRSPEDTARFSRRDLLAAGAAALGLSSLSLTVLGQEPKPVSGADNPLLKRSPIAQVYNSTLYSVLALRAANGMPYNGTATASVPESGFMKSADIGFMWMADILAALNHQRIPAGNESNPAAVTARIRKSLTVYRDLVNRHGLKVDGKPTGILPEFFQFRNGQLVPENRPLPGRERGSGIVYAAYDMMITSERLLRLAEIFKGGIVEGLEDEEIATLANTLVQQTNFSAFISADKVIHSQVFILAGKRILSEEAIDNAHSEAKGLLPLIYSGMLGDPAKPLDERIAEGEQVWNKLWIRWENKRYSFGSFQVAEGDGGRSAFAEYYGNLFYDESGLAPLSEGVSHHNYFEAGIMIGESLRHQIFFSAPGTGRQINQYGQFGLNRSEVVVPAGSFLALTSGDARAIDNVEKLIALARENKFIHTRFGLPDAVNPLVGKAFHEKRIFMNQALILESINYAALREIEKRMPWHQSVARVLSKLDERYPAPVELLREGQYEVKSSYDVMRAGSIGTFHVDGIIKGFRDGSERKVDDADLKKKVLEVSYNVKGAGSAIGVWFKVLPDPFRFSEYNALRIRYKGSDAAPEQFMVEVKASRQSPQVTIGEDREKDKPTAEWKEKFLLLQPGIGDFQQVILHLNHDLAGENPEGKIYFDLEFVKVVPKRSEVREETDFENGLDYILDGEVRRHRTQEDWLNLARWFFSFYTSEEHQNLLTPDERKALDFTNEKLQEIHQKYSVLSGSEASSEGVSLATPAEIFESLYDEEFTKTELEALVLDYVSYVNLILKTRLLSEPQEPVALKPLPINALTEEQRGQFKKTVKRLMRQTQYLETPMIPLGDPAAADEVLDVTPFPTSLFLFARETGLQAERHSSALAIYLVNPDNPIQRVELKSPADPRDPPYLAVQFEKAPSLNEHRLMRMFVLKKPLQDMPDESLDETSPDFLKTHFELSENELKELAFESSDNSIVKAAKILRLQDLARSGLLLPQDTYALFSTEGAGRFAQYLAESPAEEFAFRHHYLQRLDLLNRLLPVTWTEQATYPEEALQQHARDFIRTNFFPKTGTSDMYLPLAAPVVLRDEKGQWLISRHDLPEFMRKLTDMIRAAGKTNLENQAKQIFDEDPAFAAEIWPVFQAEVLYSLLRGMRIPQMQKSGAYIRDVLARQIQHLWGVDVQLAPFVLSGRAGDLETRYSEVQEDVRIAENEFWTSFEVPRGSVSSARMGELKNRILAGLRTMAILKPAKVLPTQLFELNPSKQPGQVQSVLKKTKHLFLSLDIAGAVAYQQGEIARRVRLVESAFRAWKENNVHDYEKTAGLLREAIENADGTDFGILQRLAERVQELLDFENSGDISAIIEKGNAVHQESRRLRKTSDIFRANLLADHAFEILAVASNAAGYEKVSDSDKARYNLTVADILFDLGRPQDEIMTFPKDAVELDPGLTSEVSQRIKNLAKPRSEVRNAPLWPESFGLITKEVRELERWVGAFPTPEDQKQIRRLLTRSLQSRINSGYAFMRSNTESIRSLISGLVKVADDEMEEIVRVTANLPTGFEKLFFLEEIALSENRKERQNLISYANKFLAAWETVSLHPRDSITSKRMPIKLRLPGSFLQDGGLYPSVRQFLLELRKTGFPFSSAQLYILSPLLEYDSALLVPHRTGSGKVSYSTIPLYLIWDDRTVESVLNLADSGFVRMDLKGVIHHEGWDAEWKERQLADPDFEAQFHPPSFVILPRVLDAARELKEEFDRNTEGNWLTQGSLSISRGGYTVVHLRDENKTRLGTWVWNGRKFINRSEVRNLESSIRSFVREIFQVPEQIAAGRVIEIRLNKDGQNHELNYRRENQRGRIPVDWTLYRDMTRVFQRKGIQAIEIQGELVAEWGKDSKSVDSKGHREAVWALWSLLDWKDGNLHRVRPLAGSAWTSSAWWVDAKNHSQGIRIKIEKSPVRSEVRSVSEEFRNEFKNRAHDVVEFITGKLTVGVIEGYKQTVLTSRQRAGFRLTVKRHEIQLSGDNRTYVFYSRHPELGAGGEDDQVQRIARYFAEKLRKSETAFRLGVGPETVRFYHGRVPFLIQKEVEGKTTKLKDWNLELVNALGYALGRLHGAGIVHGDIWFEDKLRGLYSLMRDYIFVERPEHGGPIVRFIGVGVGPFATQNVDEEKGFVLTSLYHTMPQLDRETIEDTFIQAYASGKLSVRSEVRAEGKTQKAFRKWVEPYWQDKLNDSQRKHLLQKIEKELAKSRTHVVVTGIVLAAAAVAVYFSFGFYAALILLPVAVRAAAKIVVAGSIWAMNRSDFSSIQLTPVYDNWISLVPQNEFSIAPQTWKTIDRSGSLGNFLSLAALAILGLLQPAVLAGLSLVQWLFGSAFVIANLYFILLEYFQLSMFFPSSLEKRIAKIFPQNPSKLEKIAEQIQKIYKSHIKDIRNIRNIDFYSFLILDSNSQVFYVERNPTRKLEDFSFEFEAVSISRFPVPFRFKGELITTRNIKAAQIGADFYPVFRVIDFPDALKGVKTEGEKPVSSQPVPFQEKTEPAKPVAPSEQPAEQQKEGPSRTELLKQAEAELDALFFGETGKFKIRADEVIERAKQKPNAQVTAFTKPLRKDIDDAVQELRKRFGLAEKDSVELNRYRTLFVDDLRSRIIAAQKTVKDEKRWQEAEAAEQQRLADLAEEQRLADLAEQERLDAEAARLEAERQAKEQADARLRAGLDRLEDILRKQLSQFTKPEQIDEHRQVGLYRMQIQNETVLSDDERAEWSEALEDLLREMIEKKFPAPKSASPAVKPVSPKPPAQQSKSALMTAALMTAESLSDDERYQDAIHVLNSAIEKDPGNIFLLSQRGWIHLYLGKERFESGQGEDARDEFALADQDAENVLMIDPTNASALKRQIVARLSIPEYGLKDVEKFMDEAEKILGYELTDYRKRLAELRKSRSEVRLAHQIIPVVRAHVAIALTNRIARRIDASIRALFRMLYPDEETIDLELSQENTQARERIYAGLFRGPANIILPAYLLGNLSPAVREKYLTAVMRGYLQSGISAVPQVIFAGDGASGLKEEFYGLDFFKTFPEAQKIFRIQSLDEKLVASQPQLRERNLSVSVLEAETNEVRLDYRIPAFLVSREELSGRDEIEKYRYLHALTQIQLLAAEELKESLRGVHPRKAAELLQQFLDDLGIRSEIFDGMVVPSIQSLIAEEVTDRVAAHTSVSRAA